MAGEEGKCSITSPAIGSNLLSLLAPQWDSTSSWRWREGPRHPLLSKLVSPRGHQRQVWGTHRHLWLPVTAVCPSKPAQSTHSSTRTCKELAIKSLQISRFPIPLGIPQVTDVLFRFHLWRFCSARYREFYICCFKISHLSSQRGICISFRN